MQQILSLLGKLPAQPYYWLALILGGCSLIGVALYFQYGLDELPCVMCIQVRLLVILMIISALPGLLKPNNRTVTSISLLLTTLVAAGLTERSYQLLGTERGFVFSDCGFSLGLPSWLALEDWFPALFRIETSCGYTPELFFGITMAEALMVMSVLLLLLSLMILFASLLAAYRRH